jgi:chitin disaccharide deacetylase
VILCADDYGLSQDIDEAILDLCRAGKLTAVSCMAALQQFSPDSLSQLPHCERAVDIGLHLCLTHQSTFCAEAKDTLDRGGGPAVRAIPLPR